MVSPLLANHSCKQCAKDVVGIQPLVQTTAHMIVVHEHIKDKFRDIPRENLSTKAALTLIQAEKDVKAHLNSLEPIERAKAIRLARCLFATLTSKL